MGWKACACGKKARCCHSRVCVLEHRVQQEDVGCCSLLLRGCEWRLVVLCRVREACLAIGVQAK